MLIITHLLNLYTYHLCLMFKKEMIQNVIMMPE